MTLSSRRRWTAWARWPDPVNGPYHVGFTWSAEATTRAELTGFELWTRPPADERVNDGPTADMIDLLTDPPKLTARLLHDFPLSRVARATRTASVDTLAADSHGEVAVAAAEALKPSRGSRYPIEHYKAVAEVYREASTGAVYDTLRARWPASKSTLAHWVSRCRTLGLLPAR